MKLQQLRYIWEVAQHSLNVSATAEALYTSQPGISKQIRLLEEELGVEIFARDGKHFTHVTQVGQVIIDLAGNMLNTAQSIKNAALEYRDEKQGRLTIATTHTQARYALPKVIKAFINKYPNVALDMHQGTPEQIAEMAAKGQVDFAVATEALEHCNNITMLPCYRWNRTVIVPKGHPLTQVRLITLESIARFPIITYVFGFTGRSLLDQAFLVESLQPKVVFTAVDADVIKTYVRLNLGIGIIASMAYDAAYDDDLVAIDVSHLFETSVTKIGFKKGTFLRGYMYEFLEFFAPHLTRGKVQQAAKLSSQKEIDKLFDTKTLPLR